MVVLGARWWRWTMLVFLVVGRLVSVVLLGRWWRKVSGIVGRMVGMIVVHRWWWWWRWHPSFRSRWHVRMMMLVVMMRMVIVHR